MQVLQKEEYYTYADYAAWDDDARWELIDGAPHMMSPAPRTKHQRLIGEIFRQFSNFLIGKTCEAFVAPFDVRLNADTYDDTVVQPDISIVCDKSKIDKKGCRGAPDMIVEILSPSSLGYDRVLKFNKYLQAGVREYWIVDPEGKTVSVHILENGKYVATAYGETDSVPVHVLEGCEIDMGIVFAE